MSKKKGEIFIREAPERFKLEDTTIWSFPERGNWATHSGKDVYKRQSLYRFYLSGHARNDRGNRISDLYCKYHRKGQQL